MDVDECTRTGSTGAFIDPAYDIWYVIALGNANHAPRWVVW